MAKLHLAKTHYLKHNIFQNQHKMNDTNQFPDQVRSISEAAADCNSIPGIQIKTGRKDSSFRIMDSAGMELFPLMRIGETDEAVILYIEKGEVILEQGRETYTLSKGMLFYRIPKLTVQLLSFSEDCHFKVFCFRPDFEMTGGMPIKHLNTITVLASNNPVLTLDTLTAAAVTVLFWLLQKKLSWGAEAQPDDETVQHVFSLLILEIVFSFKRKIEDNAC
jgi:hypothetical protein